MHILGATQEGKSKLIELLIRDDIKNGYGCCLLDMSRPVSTVDKVLNYCASIGFEKVCLINPVDFLKFDKIPVLKPLKYSAPPAVSVGNVMDVLQVIWNTKDFSATPRIQKYAPAVLEALMASRLALSDVQYLLTRQDFYVEQEVILNADSLDRGARNHLRGALRGNPATFEQYQSSINRLDVFRDYLLRYVFGADSPGLQWSKMITDGWLILVKLFPKDVWGDQHLQQRVLGTFVISEILYAINRLQQRGWGKPFYMYIDEAGMYATRKLSDILDYHGKTPARLILAHQRFSQFDDNSVLDSVRQNAKNKVLFYSPNRLDRETMMRDMGYGGDLPDRQVSHILAGLEKGQAAVTVGKSSPRLVKITHIPDVPYPAKSLIDFKKKLYSMEGFYQKEFIETQINARFTHTQSQPPITIRKRTDRQPTVEPARGKGRKKQDQGSTKPGTRRAVPDDSADSPIVLRRSPGRATRKISPSETDEN